MKNRILEKFPLTRIESYNCFCIYVADFTKRTKSARGVEVSSTMPKCPVKPENDMDVLYIDNKSGLSVVFATFNDNSFKDADGNDESHTEGAFFIDNEQETFFALYEIKDCRPSRIGNYRKDIKEKVKLSAAVVRDNNIVDGNKKIHALVSFPRQKMRFNNYLYGIDPIEMTELRKKDKIIFCCSNSFKIANSSNLVAFYE
ncbi:MAG: hypothetical protein SNH63_03050 [Rikenellaceae bacterium]